MDSMMSYTDFLEHDVFSCSCANCKWVQNAFAAYNKMIGVTKKN